MFARLPAWHGEGNVIDHWPGSWEEACRFADLTWDVEAWPVYAGGTPVVAVHNEEEITFTMGSRSIDGWMALIRDDTHQVLDVVPPTYTPLTNAEFGEIVESVIELMGAKAQFEALVVLRGGKVIAVTLVAPAREVPGDPSPLLPYIAGWTSHDRSAACKIGATMVRVVCANTWSAADADMEGHKSGFVIRHTSRMKEHLEQIAMGLQIVLDRHDAFHAAAVELAGKPVSRVQVEEFVDIWIPVATDMTARQLDNVHASRGRFWDVYEGEAGQMTMEGIRGNAWGLFQASVETADWYSPYKNTDTLINRQLLSGDSRKSYAMTALARVL
jgi:phage/plasmid-like protein (TIGR03299 family)